MSIRDNYNGTYTVVLVTGSKFTGTYTECQNVIKRIIKGDTTVYSILTR